MTRLFVEDISTEGVGEPEHPMPAACAHTKTSQFFHWGSLLAAVVAGFIASAYAYELVDELFSVSTQGWGVLSAFVWFSCTAIGANIAWIGVRVLGFVADEVLHGSTQPPGETSSSEDLEGDDER